MTPGSSTTSAKNPEGHPFMHGVFLVFIAGVADFVFRGCQCC
jgi:hypothetical protein